MMKVILFDFDGVLYDTSFNSYLSKLIDKLRETYKIGLLSNQTADSAKYIRKVFDLDSKFDYVFLSSEIGYYKPDKEVFEYVQKELDVEFDETVFIDDNEDNVSAASNLGIKAILFEGNEKLIRDLEKLGIKT